MISVVFAGGLIHEFILGNFKLLVILRILVFLAIILAVIIHHAKIEATFSCFGIPFLFWFFFSL